MTNKFFLPALEAQSISIYYDRLCAIRNISLKIQRNQVTSIIGPSGCGKSTLLRCFNRMNELIPNCRLDGTVLFNGDNIYSDKIDVTELRTYIGMVFQKPNPFPKSIYDNVAFGPRILNNKSNLDDIVEKSLKNVGLWDDVKNNLKKNAYDLSGGQQQRLCIARALAVEPEILLMDEPCSALDPISTSKIEDLITDLKKNYTIVIVTHNMQQAARISDFTAVLMMGDQKEGYLTEYGSTNNIFTKPKNKQTENYILGRIG